MNDPRYCAYFTRHMPVALRARLHALAEQRSRRNGRRVLVEDVLVEALEIGVEQLEGPGRPAKFVDWAAVPDREENDGADEV